MKIILPFTTSLKAFSFHMQNINAHFIERTEDHQDCGELNQAALLLLLQTFKKLKQLKFEKCRPCPSLPLPSAKITFGECAAPTSPFPPEPPTTGPAPPPPFISPALRTAKMDPPLSHRRLPFDDDDATAAVITMVRRRPLQKDVHTPRHSVVVLTVTGVGCGFAGAIIVVLVWVTWLACRPIKAPTAATKATVTVGTQTDMQVTEQPEPATKTPKLDTASPPLRRQRPTSLPSEKKPRRPPTPHPLARSRSVPFPPLPPKNPSPSPPPPPAAAAGPPPPASTPPPGPLKTSMYLLGGGKAF